MHIHFPWWAELADRRLLVLKSQDIKTVMIQIIHSVLQQSYMLQRIKLINQWLSNINPSINHSIINQDSTAVRLVQDDGLCAVVSISGLVRMNPFDICIFLVDFCLLKFALHACGVADGFGKGRRCWCRGFRLAGDVDGFLQGDWFLFV